MPEDARRHNRALVLRTLFRGGPLSRADLARVTRLTPASMSDLVGELLEAGIVEEVGRREGQGVGKPATLLEIVPDARHVVCLDLSDDAHLHGARVNLAGKVLDRRTVDWDGRTGDAAVELAAQLAVDLVRSSDAPVLGIGVGSPGVVDANGVVLEAAGLRWHGVPVAERIAAAVGAAVGGNLRVDVVNDANAAALAERTFGTAEGPAAQNLLLVKIGQGVGAGLLIDGRLFVGDRFAAGEIGHVVVDERGDVCVCGRRGCLETVVAMPNVRRRLAEAGPSGHSRVLAAAGRRLGGALATVVSTLNLDHVVLSGPAELLGEPFRSAVADTIRRRAIPAVAEHVELTISSLGEDDVLLGAAVMVLAEELGVV